MRLSNHFNLHKKECLQMKSPINSRAMKAVLLGGSLLGAASVMNAETLQMNVPFAFAAGGKMLNAGSYSVEAEGNTLMLRGAGSMTLFAVPSLNDSVGTKYGATFEQGATGAALASVSLSNGMTYIIPAAKRSTRLAASPPEGAVLSRKR
jgi:hypothetical protein